MDKPHKPSDAEREDIFCDWCDPLPPQCKARQMKRPDVEGIMQRWAKVTPGKWEWQPHEEGCDRETGPWGEPPTLFVHTGRFYKNSVSGEESDLLGYAVHSDADAQAIAAAPTDIAELCKYVLALEGRR